MNPRIQKVNDDIEKTKGKIAELQALLPELERKKTELENTEIIRLVRMANVAPGDLTAFIASLKTGNMGVSSPARPAAAKQEVSDHEDE